MGGVPLVEGTSRCLGGEGNLPLAAAPRRLDLLGWRTTPHGPPIYSGGEEGSYLEPLVLSPLPVTSLSRSIGEALLL